MSSYEIAISSLNAQRQIVAAHGANIVNAQSNGKDNPQPGDHKAYAPVDPVTISAVGSGVAESNLSVTPASVASYDPDSPAADPNGIVAAPNIDLAQEFIGIDIAKTTYAASAKIIKAQDAMDQALLDILT